MESKRMKAKNQGFGVRQLDLGSNRNLLLMSLVALLILFICSIDICDMGVRTSAYYFRLLGGHV